MVLIMKKRLNILFFVLLFCFLATDIYGQARLLRYGDKQQGLENYAKAAEAYKEAYARRAVYGTAVKLAETYGQLGMYTDSYEWWGRAVSFDESGREEYAAYLLSAVQAGQWESIEGLLSAAGYTAYDFPELDLEGMRALREQRASVKLVPVPGVNSSGSDFGSSVDADGSLYFSSDRGQVGDAGSRPGIRLDAKANIFSDERSSYNEREFYRIYRKDSEGEFSVVVTDLSDALHVNDPSVVQDLGMVFYTAFVGKSRIRGSRDFTNHAGIYYGRVDAEGNITQSTSFPYNDHQSYGVMNPFVDTEANRIYFASDMPGGQGGFDIYYVEYDGEMNFSAPVNLGPGVNTAENESHPSRTGDMFYFSSRGHMGLGGMDVFTADYSGGSISNVRNMGLPYNSERDDFAFLVAGDGKRYISSDREGGMGLDDIYTIEDLFKTLLAKVSDCDGNVVRDYASELKGVDRSAVGTKLDADGQLLAELDPDGDFVLRISKKGHFAISDSSITTRGFDGDTLRRDYVLAAIPYRAQAVMDYLVKRGVSSDRMEHTWYGESRPVKDCSTGDCTAAQHQQNRRTMLRVSTK